MTIKYVDRIPNNYPSSEVTNPKIPTLTQKSNVNYRLTSYNKPISTTQKILYTVAAIFSFGLAYALNSTVRNAVKNGTKLKLVYLRIPNGVASNVNDIANNNLNNTQSSSSIPIPRSTPVPPVSPQPRQQSQRPSQYSPYIPTVPNQRSNPSVENILAAHGHTQYSYGGNAACTPLCCFFLNNNVSANPQALDLHLEQIGSNYTSPIFTPVEQILPLCYSLRPIALNPMGINRSGIQELIEGNDFGVEKNVGAYRHFLNFFMANNNFTKAIITGDNITIALRKTTTGIEFFDPHGNLGLNNQQPGAYVKRFVNDKLDSAVQYLNQLFNLVVEEFDQGQMMYGSLTIHPFY